MRDQANELTDLMWPHSGHTRALNAAAYYATMNTVSAGQCGKGQVANAAVDLYGSDGGTYMAPAGYEEARDRYLPRRQGQRMAALLAYVRGRPWLAPCLMIISIGLP